VPSRTNVAEITQTSVTLSWSTGHTRVINDTVVHYKATGSDQWTSVSAVSGTSHNVTGLRPGTEYQFFVQISSYGKSSSSQNITKTTGNAVACFLCTIFSKSLIIIVIIIIIIKSAKVGIQSSKPTENEATVVHNSRVLFANLSLKLFRQIYIRVY